MRKILILLCVFAVSLYAATTGKIVGRIYDASTGEALPGVNVIIEGTTMGAATDPDGYFVILNVSPGTYDVTARMMGYQDVTVEDVLVETDLTQTLEFALKSEAIAVKGVTVKAKRPIIKKDVTTSVSIVSADEMESTPVNTIQGIVGRQAGVVNSGFLHIRGGRNTEIVYVLNGVELRDPYAGTFDSRIPQESVQETSVYTGGFGAEYGNAQSGIINVVTKSGGSKYNFTVKARTNDAFGIDGLQDFIDNNYSIDTTYQTVGTSDTATPYVYINENDTTYFEGPFDVVTHSQPDGRTELIYVNDTLMAEDWRPEKMKRIDFSLSGPIIGKNLRFFIGGEYSSDMGHHSNFDNDRQAYSGKITFKPSQNFKFVTHGLYHMNDFKWYYAQWKFNFDNVRYVEDRSYTYGINLTHAINPRIIHEFMFNNYTTKRLGNVFEDGSYDLNGDGIIDERDIDGIDDFSDNDNDGNVEINGEERGFDWPELDVYPYTRTTNYDGYILNGYNRIAWQFDEHKTYTGKWDLTAQIGKIHEIKVGLSAKKYDVFVHIADMASGGNVYMTEARSEPYQFSAYIQDKLEQDIFILNGGLRFDYFNSNAEVPSDPYNPVYDISSGGEIRNPIIAKSKWALSPRVGFSFPITEYDKFHFTYGHYFQMPPMQFMYANQNYDLSGAFPLIGNPNVEPEKTVSYEFGIQHAFNDEVLLDLTAYMRDISGLTDTEQIFYSMVNYYTIYSNADYGSSRGIEINFSKRRGGIPAWLTWNVNYTFGVARGKSSSTRQNYDFIWAGYEVPAEEHYLNWDQRHTLNADVGIHSPDGEALFGIPGLDNFGVNFSTAYGSGLPWTPPSRTREQLINEERLPWTLVTDVRFYKNFEIGRLKIGLFGDIYHLFDNWGRDVINRYYFDLNDYENWYNAYGDPRGAYKDARIYDPNRYMRFGVSVKI